MKTVHIRVLSIILLLSSMGGPITWAKEPDGRDASVNANTAAALKLKTGAAFLQTRARIVNAGWKPIPMHRHEVYDYSGTEKILADRGFFEVDSCTTDAGSLCILYYSKASRCLRLDTVGEQIKDMRIREWTNECPVTTSPKK